MLLLHLRGSTPPIKAKVVRTGYVGFPPTEEYLKYDHILELLISYDRSSFPWKRIWWNKADFCMISFVWIVH